MESYSILIVGMYGIPSHIIRFIRNLKQTNPSAHISLFSERKEEEFSHEIGEYLEEYIQCVSCTKWPPQLRRLKKYYDRYILTKQLRRIANTRHYDIVNIHYPTYRLGYVMRYFRRMSNTVVVSPWGSDVLRVAGPRVKKILSRVFKCSDFITVDSRGIFKNVLCNEMNIEKEKFHPLVWGSETIDYINDHLSEVSREHAKKLLDLEGKYLITCGYNAFEEQRHEIIINSINAIRNQLQSNMVLLFPLTYGSSSGTRKVEHVKKVKTLCADLDLPAVYYESYLSVSELFLLRRATDMFIHIQPTDGGNSSLQEYVLCGSKVVHGTWIHYHYLEQYSPLFYFPVNNIEDLGDVILNAYYSEPIQIPDEVMTFIRNRGWRAKMLLWNDFFISCLKK